MYQVSCKRKFPNIEKYFMTHNFINYILSPQLKLNLQQNLKQIFTKPGKSIKDRPKQ